MPTETKDVSTSSGGTVTVPALTAPALGGGLAPALPPGALVGRGVAQTLQRLADDHNARHGTDRRKRADVRALRAAYRRGAARKPRPGRSRRQEGLARAQAHLAALAGKALPADYADDAVLLPGESKRLAVLALEGTVAEPLEHLKAVSAELAPAPVQHQQERKDAADAAEPVQPVAVETKTWGDEARVAALLARREHTKTKVGDLAPGQHVRFDKPTPGGGMSDTTHVEGVVSHVAPHPDGDRAKVVHLTDGTSHNVLGTVEAAPAGDATPAELSKAAKDATYQATTPALHEAARQAHLAAADAHLEDGNETGALEHVSMADHHQLAAELAGPQESHHFPVGSRVAAPSGKEGEVIAHGENGTAVKHDDGTVAVHKPSTLTLGSDNTLRGTVAAHEAKPGDYVWDVNPALPGGGPGYRIQSAERHGDTVHHRFDDGLGTGHRYHHADAQLRIVRGADASRSRY